MTARLIVLAGPDAGKEFPLEPGLHSLGRADANAMVLTDPLVSRRQCDLSVFADRLEITDRGSGNGTLVNGLRITQQVLHPGDRIAIGDSLLLVSESGTAPPGVVRTVPEDAGSVIWSEPESASSDWLRRRLAHLGVLYEATTAVGEILDVDRLLDRLLDLALGSLEADVGFVFLANEDDATWRVNVSKSKSQPGTPTVYSRTIVDYVRTNRVGVLAADATSDDRFAGGESIARQGIREVIAVPMKGRHGILGAFVLETVSSRRKTDTPTRFTDDHLALASALAHQAALAVEETRYYRAMLQSEKLAAVGTAVAHLSHHIKNIMHGVRFGGDLLNRGLAERDELLTRKGWSLVERNQLRIDDLIHDMLSYSKDREPVREPTDLNRLLAEVVETVRGRAGESGVRLVYEPSAIPEVSCDREGIFRALLNVATNAVDAVLDQPEPRVTLTIAHDSRDIRIEITDNGPGIPAERCEEIFKPFVSTKGSRGTGLGLPVSRKIFREHGGDLTVEAGAGAKFLFRLPVGMPQ